MAKENKPPSRAEGLTASDLILRLERSIEKEESELDTLERMYRYNLEVQEILGARRRLVKKHKELIELLKDGKFLSWEEQ